MKILLVDDEPDIVSSLAALLRNLPGDEIKTAATGGEALQIAHAWGGIDLLISDVVMEPMDGFTLRDQIATRYPGARTLFVTGFDLSDYGEQTANHQVLAKPVAQAELLGAIAREALAQSPAADETVDENLTAQEDKSTVTEILAPPVAATPEPIVKPPAAVVPVPAPVAIPVAVARVAAPAARPVAVPVARATAVASIPKVVAAVPVTATAVPRVASAVAVPRPVATPAGPSSPMPTVKAAVTVKAVAAPAVTASKVSAPKVATPKAAAAPKVAVSSAPKPAAVKPLGPSAPRLPDDEMVGQTIGSYAIQAVLGDGHWGRVYRALQTSINRQVGFNLLSPTHSADEAARARFLGDARAKAHVQHPSILAVYEAGEANEHFFYAHEFVDGCTLEHLKGSGERLDEASAQKLLKTTAEGLDYLHTHQIPHSPIEGSSIYISTEGNPRLANLATNAATDPVPAPQEMQELGRLVVGLLPSIQSLSTGLRTILSRMVQAGSQGFGSWGELVAALKAIEPKFIPLEAARISAQERTAAAVVEAANKAQKRSVLKNVGSMIAIVLLGTFLVWRFFSTNERNLAEQIQIPAGSFPYGNPPQPTEVGEFWIDKYEVSIGQYAKFVKALEDHPTSEFDHELQPRIKTAEMHKPRDWAIYYGRAATGQPIHSVPSDLNMPALMVDWWDAYAYAKWLGRELPTEQEWEKAARGTQGFTYPWGNEFEAKKVNSNADFTLTNPGAPGKVDGFNYWGAVDQQRDKSPYGVIGMAGNVAEWTATWTKDKKFPVIRGGSYMSADVRLDKRTDSVAAQVAQENLGFRTISRKPPAP